MNRVAGHGSAALSAATAGGSGIGRSASGVGSGARLSARGSGDGLSAGGSGLSASGSGARLVGLVVVPKLPASPDGAKEIAALDQRIEIHRDEPELEILLLLERASIGGRLEDYVEALRRSAAWVRRAPQQRAAWQTRAQVLTRVHEFAAARAALGRLRALVRQRDAIEGLEATIEEATGTGGAAYRERMAHDYPDPTTLTQWAASLAAAGRFDEALAAMQRVPALIHDNPPELLSWILFQWGRIYERKGLPGAARSFFEAAHARLPTLEATVHLAQTMTATGGDPSLLVTAALATNRHPELLALAGELAERGRPGAGGALIAEAARAWERYVAALPSAFAAQAARFYLGPGDGARSGFGLGPGVGPRSGSDLGPRSGSDLGPRSGSGLGLGIGPGVGPGVSPSRDAARAYALARMDHAGRDTPEARALVVEAALAAGDTAGGCALAPRLAQGEAAHQLLAWRAYRACGRADEAAALAARLWIR